MSVGERDPHSGHMTTGHEWNGIKELNTPVPRPVWAFLTAAFVFSVLYWVLMPAWPIGTTYTKGLLGVDERQALALELAAAAENRNDWAGKVQAADYAEVQADDRLIGFVRLAGRVLFSDNCAVCHGSDAKGAKGFPDLTDTAWLWGGDTETVMETLRVGINSLHSDTRFAEMPPFGLDQTLTRDQVEDVVAYVMALAAAAAPGNGTEAATAPGREIFAENCVPCHGENGKGIAELGAPDLTDGSWTYGGSRQTVFDTVWQGRSGHMPAWEPRLSEIDRKILALYVIDLGAREQE